MALTFYFSMSSQLLAGSKGAAGLFSFPYNLYLFARTLHIHFGAANSNLLTHFYRLCHMAFILAWLCHSAQDCILYLCRDTSFEQAHGTWSSSKTFPRYINGTSNRFPSIVQPRKHNTHRIPSPVPNWGASFQVLPSSATFWQAGLSSCLLELIMIDSFFFSLWLQNWSSELSLLCKLLKLCVTVFGLFLTMNI
jgi:hypothetical protein